MEQYNSIKAQHPDAILLFRVGDFYETFGDDAITTSNILGIVLTARNNGESKIELSGFPYHALDNYLPKLVRSGKRVAICEQLENPKLTKKIVKRGITELVTPGLSYNSLVLEDKKNNFLASIFYTDYNVGVSFLDISTGEFLVSEGNKDYIDKLVQSFNPSEVLYQKGQKHTFLENNGIKYNSYALDNWVFETNYTNELLQKHFKTKNLKGFGVDSMHNAKVAAGVILHYLQETQHNNNTHIIKLNRIIEDSHVWMDRFTIRNLELFNTLDDGAVAFVDIIDNTLSAMGSRMVKKWIAFPLKEKSLINERLSIVDFLLKNHDLTKIIKENISKIGDIERIISRVANNRVTPRECIQLKIGLDALVPIKDVCQRSTEKKLNDIGNKIDLCNTIKEDIERIVNSDAPALLNKGNIINNGVNLELDNLREIANAGKSFLNKILEREIKKTGILSLKISFNNVFGYYLEVRNKYKEKVPETWIRKQTLVSAERYITEELKEYEAKIINAQERIVILEHEIYNELVNSLGKFILPIQIDAKLIAKLDCLYSFASISKKYNYKKPIIKNGKELVIKEGRHPVIERQLNPSESYIPNSLRIDRDKQQIIMLTGPNMSGKSAILRQTALIVLMAQIGCFVSAEHAEIGIVDKIFTRVGASDNISMGESTFMVEMNETASILNNLSERSLILLDEIGRGTSTYDGVSIAWAIAEFLHEDFTKAKTLFATHYHELNEMTNLFKRIKNYNVSVKEVDGNIIFIRKLKEGGSAHSFGINVAKMAGMPIKIVKRANIIMQQLEDSRSLDNIKQKAKAINNRDDLQLSFFKLDDPVLMKIRDEIMDINIDNLTPVEALTKLNHIKKSISKK